MTYLLCFRRLLPVGFTMDALAGYSSDGDSKVCCIVYSIINLFAVEILWTC